MASFFRVLCASTLCAALTACGGSGGDSPGPGLDDSGLGDAGSEGGLGFGGKHDLTLITIDPATASVESLNGTKPTQKFTAVGHFADGTTASLGTGVTWNVTAIPVGAIDVAGLYTASGVEGGVVKVSATSKGQTGTAQLTVKLHLQDNVGNIGPAAQAALLAASTPDPTVVWAYPYDGTVFPRGLGAPPLMWNGGGATDAYYVHLTSAVFELESFASAPPPSNFAFAGSAWQGFTNSTAGAADLKVARFANNGATIIAHHHWTIASAPLHGSVYYWSNNLGRVERIKPGAIAPDDFANAAPLNDPAQYPQSTCLMTCHTVSADGSTLVSGGGTFGGSYDLKTGQPIKNLGYGWGTPAQGWQNIQWLAPALSPTGKYVALNAQVNQLTPVPTPPGPTNLSGLFLTATGAKVANSGLDAMNLYTPAWSPDGTAIAYVTSSDSPWAGGAVGSLNVLAFNETQTPMASGDKKLIDPGSDPTRAMIAWPTFTPDSASIIYQRGTSTTTWQTHQGDLFIANVATANQQIELAALNGKTYPFAAGDRDRHYNFEPAFAPVAAGGYFWVVFTSRRTYGNAMTGDTTTVKQLWVAAIDEKMQPSVDPSHPAFLLPGQGSSLNMRGYWALDPCKGDGQGCASGTECCGGYCDGSSGDGGLVCKSSSTSCANNGDHCQQTSDCCGAASGVTCINHVCSEPTPK